VIIRSLTLKHAIIGGGSVLAIVLTGAGAWLGHQPPPPHSHVTTVPSPVPQTHKIIIRRVIHTRIIIRRGVPFPVIERTTTRPVVRKTTIIKHGASPAPSPSPTRRCCARHCRPHCHRGHR
jgi:hypothetical protein